jgi:hypothetical protein
VHGLEAKYSGRVRFAFLNADDPWTGRFRRDLGFYVQPEFYLLAADGTVLQKWVGYITEREFDAAVAEHQTKQTGPSPPLCRSPHLASPKFCASGLRRAPAEAGGGR